MAVTSKSVGRTASRVLRSKRASKDAKSLAASALRQTRRRGKRSSGTRKRRRR